MPTPSPAPFAALIVDDDPGVRQSLRLCLEAGNARAFGVGTSAGALEALERARYDVVLLDLWLGAESGLDLLPEILRRQPGVAVIVITAFATFESAVQAMKAGAVDYLPKPADADDVVRALLARDDGPAPPENPMSADRVRWEHIQRVYELCGHNVSETARRLNMHRRTLQRILAKRSPR